MIGTGNDDDAGGIAIHSSGDIYLTGFTGGELDGNSTLGNKDVFLIKYNPSGTKPN